MPRRYSGIRLQNIERTKIRFDGRLIRAPKHVNRQSINVMKIMKAVADTRGTGNAPAKKAHEECKRLGKTVKQVKYIPNVGYQEVDVCPAPVFWSILEKTMADVVGPVAKSKRSEVLSAGFRAIGMTGRTGG